MTKLGADSPYAHAQQPRFSVRVTNGPEGDGFLNYPPMKLARDGHRSEITQAPHFGRCARQV
jgi:hypothetical protein